MRVGISLEIKAFDFSSRGYNMHVFRIHVPCTGVLYHPSLRMEQEYWLTIMRTVPLRRNQEKQRSLGPDLFGFVKLAP